MKKRMMTVGAVLVMAVMMLCGCTNSKKNYQSEMEIFGDILEMKYEKLSPADVSEELNDILEEFEAKTDEGIVLQESFTEFAELVADAVAEGEKDAPDKEKMERYQEKITKLGKDLEDNVEEFLDAAEDAGVDEDDIEDLEDIDVKKLAENTALAVAFKRASDYENDVDALTDLINELDDLNYDYFDTVAEEYESLLSQLNVVTPGGRRIKALFAKLGNVYGLISKAEYAYGYNSDEYWDVYEVEADHHGEYLEELYDEIYDFMKEAEKMGIDCDDLDDAWYYFY